MGLRVDRDGGVRIVTLDRPEVRNALDLELLTALRSTIGDFGADEQVRAVVLTGADPAFCAGLDLKEVAGSGANLTAALDGAGPFPRIGKPVIAAVNGAAYTGGLELALCCDIRIASERAVFGDTHARVRVMPGWGLTVRLPAVVGQARALQMSLGGTRVDGRLAEAWGLVNAVVPHDELLATAVGMAHRVAELESTAAARLLAMYRDAARWPESEALAREIQAARDWVAARDGGSAAGRLDR